MSIRIITDSAADFSAAELKEYSITAVPLQVIFGQDAYTDGQTLTPDIFWERLTSGENPTTSQPSPDAFLTAFEDALAAGDDVVCISLTAALSGTMQSATIAASMVDQPDRIDIVNSKLVATAQKLLVLQACRLRDEGKTAAQIVETIKALRARIRLYACLDTLEYLARGGRIPKAVASVGGAVRFKPLITLSDEGAVELCGKGIGLHRATDALIKLVEKHTIDRNYPVLPLYTHTPDNCQAFIKKLGSAGISCDAEDMCAVGATIGTHAGPGAFGLVFVEAE
ncbi:MAG: DegV family protein [Clostridia bacterium]|nr:DegV family protein [Clostridia bacterium]